MTPPSWQAAASFAARAHRNQIRKDTSTPYISHPVRVAMTVALVFGCSDETAITVALLHDTIEDTTTDYDDLEEHFGRAVADCVASLTKNMSLREDIREPEYDSRLAKADWRARLVKLGDQFDNLCDLDTPMRLGAVLEKCGRAIAIARPLAGERPEIARGIAALEGLMESARTRR